MFDHTLSSFVILFLEEELELMPRSIKISDFQDSPYEFLRTLNRLLNNLAACRCWSWKTHYLKFTGKREKAAAVPFHTDFFPDSVFLSHCLIIFTFSKYLKRLLAFDKVFVFTIVINLTGETAFELLKWIQKNQRFHR